MSKYELSETTIEKLEYYVYLLIDPRDNEVFYVGKGKGGRITAHIFGAREGGTRATDKVKRIRDIEDAGLEVKHDVLRHGLSEREALEVESAVIDLIGKDNLTNLMKGHHSRDRGLMTLEEIEIMYGAKEAAFEEPAILININALYRRDMSVSEIYEATRQSWKISTGRAEGIRIVCSVYHGIIREVFFVHRWYRPPDANGRAVFEGERATEDIRKKYLHKSVAKYWTKGAQGPIRYAEPDSSSVSDRGSRYDRKEKPEEASMNTEPRFEDFDELTILLKINERYRDGMSPEEIYDKTKDAWTIRLERVKGKVGLACAVDGGVIKGVFKVDDWSYYPHKGPRRKIQFKGKPAPPEIWDKYIGKSVEWKGSLVQNRTHGSVRRGWGVLPMILV